MFSAAGPPAGTASITGRLSAALSLRANFSWTFVGNGVLSLCQWGMLTALAKYGSAEIVGQYALGLTIATPIVTFAMLQLRAVQVTDARNDYAFADYFGLRIVTIAAALVVIAAWAGLGGYPAQTAWVVFWVGVGKCVDSVTDIVRGLFQRHERMDISGVSLMIKGPGALLALGAIMWWTRDGTKNVILAVAVVAVVWIVSFVAYDLLYARRLLATKAAEGKADGRVRPRFDRASMARLSWTALPLGLMMFLVTLQTNIPRFLLERWTGEKALGYFAALVYPLVAGTLIVNALGQSAAPRLAQYFVTNLPAFRRLLGRLALLGGALGVGFVAVAFVAGRPLLTLVYSAEYAEYQTEFMIVAVAAAVQFISSFLGYGLTAARVFRLLLMLAAISCVVTTVAALILVPERGLMGAALTMLVSSIVMCIVCTVAVFWVTARPRPLTTSPDNGSEAR